MEPCGAPQVTFSKVVHLLLSLMYVCDYEGSS